MKKRNKKNKVYKIKRAVTNGSFLFFSKQMNGN